jgi:hypothetical protein
MDAAGLERYLLAGVERIEADDVTMLGQHQRRLVEIKQDIWARERRCAKKTMDSEHSRAGGPPGTYFDLSKTKF